MTGPEHYEEAEKLLEEVGDPAGYGVDAPRMHVALAQVHATLALTAAQITIGIILVGRAQWLEAIQ